MDKSVETQTAPVQSTVVMECRTDLRQEIKYTWSRRGGLIPKNARIEGVSYFYRFDIRFYKCRSASIRNILNTP